MDPITAADYREIAQVDDPRLSPDGERVAFVRTEPADDESYEATVYVVPVDGGEPRGFTVDEGVDGEPRWSPDGEHLAFVSTRGADDDRQQLWLLPTDGGEATRATRVVGGVSSVAWSPDGSRIAFTQRVSADDREAGRDFAVDPDYDPEEPDPRVIDRLIYRAGTNYFDGTRSHVYVLDVEAILEGETGDEGGALEALTEGDYDHVSPEWGDESTLYYASKRGEEPDDEIVHDLFVRDLETGDVERFARTTGWTTSLAATADGRVAYAYTPEERATMRQTELVVHDRASGEEATPTESLDRTVGFGGGFEWGPDEESLYFATPEEGAVTVWTVPGDASGDPEPVLEDGHLEGFSVGAGTIAYAAGEWDHPGDVFAAPREGGESRRLTEVNRDLLAERAVAEPEEVWFEVGERGGEGDGENGGEGSDGDELEAQGWLLTPPDAEGPHPLVVEIHGGPHSMWTTSGSTWHEFQTLAARGYAVFWSNPRGSIGYGEAFASAIERDWGDVTLEDVLAGADAVCEREGIDEGNQFVTGGSFGGYMTAWTVGRTDRFRAAVSQRGVYDFTGFYGSTDAFKLVEFEYGATPWDDPELLRAQSPVSLAPEVDTPTLVLHSDRDYRTPINTAELYYLGLKKHGVETRLVRYPREGHELSRSGEPAHVVDRLERIARWFDGYSDRHDATPALERDPGEGLSAGEREDGDGPDRES